MAKRSLFSAEVTRRQIYLLLHKWPERKPRQRKLDQLECYLFFIWLKDWHPKVLERGQFGALNKLTAIQEWIGKKGARVQVE